VDLVLDDMEFIEFSPKKIEFDAAAFALELKTLPCIFRPDSLVRALLKPAWSSDVLSSRAATPENKRLN